MLLARSQAYFKKILFLLLVCIFLQAYAAADTNSDPLQPYNRVAFKFNQKFDKFLLKPSAQIYNHLLPWPLRDGIRNIFENINMIPTVGNDILQANLYQMLSDTWRFAINSTFGLGGLFDVATHIGLKPNNEDFGLTLAKWGYRSSAYVVIPIIGPSTIRDTIALPVNFFALSIWPYVSPYALRVGLLSTNVVSRRAGALDFDDLLTRAAFDPYTFEKNAYLQRRNFLIERNKHTEEPYVASNDKDVKF